MQLGKLLLRYLIFVGVPFLLARRIEKFMINRLDPEIKVILSDKLKKFPDIETISKNSNTELDTRGGAGPVAVWLAKIFVVDFAIKVAIGGAIGSTIWSGTADNAAATIAKYGTLMVNAPGKKFGKLVQKFRRIDEPQYDDIKALLLDKDLTVADKLDLLKIKIEQTIKELKGPKRTKFILFVIAALLFFFGGGALIPVGTSTAFTALMERLRALLGVDDTDNDVRQALIDVYMEYNAPLPKELVPQEIQDIMHNVD